MIATLTGLAVGMLLALALAGPAPERLQQDVELAGLVRTMVLVKGLFLVAALSLVSWRLARPVARRQLAGYSASLGLSAAALAWMWSLNAIPVAALLFYSGLIVCFLTASRDRLLLVADPQLRPRLTTHQAVISAPNRSASPNRRRSSIWQDPPPVAGASCGQEALGVETLAGAHKPVLAPVALNVLA